MNTPHLPVLHDAVLELLDPKPGESYFDGTAGYGGHAASVLERIGKGRATLVDRDPDASRHVKQRFGDRVRPIQSDYVTATTDALEAGERYDMILLDLGVSSPQLDRPERGFSFRFDGPLDICRAPAYQAAARIRRDPVKSCRSAPRPQEHRWWR